MATNAVIIPRTVSIQELIHASSAPTFPAGRSVYIRSIPAGPRGPRQFWAWRGIFQVSALSSLCVGEMPTQLVTGDGNLGLIPKREHKKLPHAKEGCRHANHLLMAC